VSELDKSGYAVVEDVLPSGLLDAVLDAMACRLSAWAREQAAGALEQAFEQWPLNQRVIELARRRVAGLGQALDISLPQGAIRRDTPMFLAGEVFALLTYPRLLEVLEPLLGPEIWLSPVGHTRMKVPDEVAPPNGLLGHVPWHQDNGVLLEEADGTEIVTVWAPLVDVDEASACLQLVPTARGSELLSHCPGDHGLRVPPSLMPSAPARPVPMRKGSVLLMHSRTLHSSMGNQVAGHVRFSLDLRYQAVGEPTGRPAFPSFCVRSQRRAPATFEQWRDGWLEARDRLADRDLGKFHRWDPGALACA
jgi:ectoine hydroxylase-related dioxygenase (phytanoyl-CoA dioxygenase family)